MPRLGQPLSGIESCEPKTGSWGGGRNLDECARRSRQPGMLPGYLGALASRAREHVPGYLGAHLGCSAIDRRDFLHFGGGRTRDGRGIDRVNGLLPLFSVLLLAYLDGCADLSMAPRDLATAVFQPRWVPR